MPAFTGGSDVGADMGTGVDVVALIAGSTVGIVAFMSDGAGHVTTALTGDQDLRSRHG